MFWYITSDTIGEESGGGAVTFHESKALAELGPCHVIGRQQLESIPKEYGGEPWCWDERVAAEMYGWPIGIDNPRIVHFYAGCWTKTIARIRELYPACKITYMAAAHDKDLSRREHEKFGIDYAGRLPHLVDPVLWGRYLGGYLAADKVVVPSRHSEGIMRGYGCRGEVVVIPHGVRLPGRVVPIPSQFRVGFFGSAGCDKGLIYLLEAWKKLAYRDAVLVLGGKDSKGKWVQGLVEHSGCSNVVMLGWVKDPSDFYNSLSVYVQPSVTEGFGIEVLEALSHGRPVICSEGVGAKDVVTEDCWIVPSADSDALAVKIDEAKRLSDWYAIKARDGNCASAKESRRLLAGKASEYSWDIIRKRYEGFWRGLL